MFGRFSRVRVSFFALLSFITVLGSWALPASINAQIATPLEGLRPFVGKTWKAAIDAESGVYDIARWDVVLAGQAVRILHSVGEGTYGGETIIVWDEAAASLVYFYFTTAGFYTRGTMSFDETGRLNAHELVTGGETGVSEVSSTQEVLPDGRMRVTTRMLRGENWEEAGDMIYEEAPDALVVLPDSAAGVVQPSSD